MHAGFLSLAFTFLISAPLCFSLSANANMLSRPPPAKHPPTPALPPTTSHPGTICPVNVRPCFPTLISPLDLNTAVPLILCCLETQYDAVIIITAFYPQSLQDPLNGGHVAPNCSSVALRGKEASFFFRGFLLCLFRSFSSSGYFCAVILKDFRCLSGDFNGTTDPNGKCHFWPWQTFFVRVLFSKNTFTHLQCFLPQFFSL